MSENRPYSERPAATPSAPPPSLQPKPKRTRRQKIGWIAVTVGWILVIWLFVNYLTPKSPSWSDGEKYCIDYITKNLVKVDTYSLSSDTSEEFLVRTSTYTGKEELHHKYQGFFESDGRKYEFGCNIGSIDNTQWATQVMIAPETPLEGEQPATTVSEDPPVDAL